MGAWVLAEMEQYLAEKSWVKIVVGLELHFDIAPGRVGPVVRRFGDAVKAERRLLDFLRDEAIACGIRHGQPGQFKGQGGFGLQQAVEKAVGFHFIRTTPWTFKEPASPPNLIQAVGIQYPLAPHQQGFGIGGGDALTGGLGQGMELAF